jgi:nicotinamide-nucleotide amidase
MHAEIIAIGDEITNGQFLDTNSQWLSLRLEELGIRVLYHTTIGDELEPIAEVFRQALARSDLIVATGGLGPTADDLTRDALALAAGRRLVLDCASLDYIRGLFARRKREMPRQNEIQAMFPEGSRVVPNPNGTAPGIDLEVPRPAAPPARIFCLPGVPAEMREMWHQTLVGALRGLGAGGRTIRQRRIKCFGAGESQIEAKLPDLIRRGRTPRVGINASQATIILRITAEGATPEECYAAMQPTADTIYETLGNLVYGEEEDEIQDAVVKLLRQRKQTLATVEWGTAGLVAVWLGATACGDAVYRGGVIVSSETVLERILDVPSRRTAEFGPSSNSEVFAAAATACRGRFAADYGLAIGPFPSLIPGAAEPEPVYIALAGPGGPAVKALPFAGHPDLLRTLFAKHALNMVRLALR